MMAAGDIKGTTRSMQLKVPRTPLREMVMYLVQPHQDGSTQKVRMPMILLVLSPQIRGPVVLDVNLGKGDSQREETTADEDGEREMSEESDLSELLETPKFKLWKDKTKTLRTGLVCVPKKAEVIILSKLWAIPFTVAR